MYSEGSWFGFIFTNKSVRSIIRWLLEHGKWPLAYYLFIGQCATLWHIMRIYSHPDEYPFVVAFSAFSSGIGGWLAGDIAKLGSGIIIGYAQPLLFVLVPVILLLLPFILLGVIVMSVGGSLFILTITGMAPLGFIGGVRGFFFHNAAKWLAHAGQREREERMVRAALGMDGASLRTVDGQARLMDEEEFLALENGGELNSDRDIKLGLFNKTSFSHQTEKHVLIVASTRGGKGRDLIIPNLNSYNGSVFVLDPKGENVRASYGKRKELGPVLVLDPFGVSGLPSARFNPLACMTPDMMVTEAQTMADALVEGEEDHWTMSARQLLTGLILHVVTWQEIEERDLPMVRQLLMRDLPRTLEDMTNNMDAPEVVRDVGEWGLTAAPEEWSSIVSNAIEQTKWMASPQIAASLQDGGEQVDFSRYRDSVQSVFVCLAAPHFRTFSKWLRLVVAAALDTLTKSLNPKMPLPTRFVLDEIAQLGNLEKIESALTLAAGYGVQLWGIWQHLKDIDRCYPRSGVAGWVSCSGIRLVFATQDNESVKYFADMSEGALMQADIRQMGPYHMVCLMDGQNPMLIERFPGPGGIIGHIERHRPRPRRWWEKGLLQEERFDYYKE